MKSSIRNNLISTVVTCIGLSLHLNAVAQIQFQETTSSAGRFVVDESWGASWGDMNSDGRPDLYVSNHRSRPSIYRNNGDGTFTDVVLTFDQSHVWLDLPLGDLHGGAWADFDRDGDQDLLVLTGSQIPPQMFVNDGGLFTDTAAALNIPDDGGGRMASWLDYDKDGLPDFAMMNSGTSKLLRQESGGGFTDVTNSVGMQCTQFRSNYVQLTDTNDDVGLGGAMELMCMRDGTSPAVVYDIASTPFQDISSTVPTASITVDSITADFDGNLKPDILFTRGNLRLTQAVEVSPGKIEARASVGDNTGEKGFIFEGDGIGILSVDVSTLNFGVFRVFLGQNGVHPTDLTFTLDPADPNVFGMAAHDPAVDKGLYIGYDEMSRQWEFQLSPGGDSTRAYIVVDTSAVISGPATTGLETGDFPIRPHLLMNTDTGGFQEEASARGLGNPISCVSVVAGDFDSDMDEDIYFVCRGGVENVQNRLYVNQGDGTFLEVAQAGGAEGVVGAGLDSSAGTGENVVTADYDLDGFLDLFIVNGLNLQPLRVGGPSQLFRNQGNANHWLQLDLQGSTANPDAVGSKVYVTAGGVTQLREQAGGYHRWSQNYQRIHVGLGTNTLADITVEWPDGGTDTYTTVSADKIYTLTQGTSEPEERTFGPVPLFPLPVVGDDCGEPVFDSSLDLAIFLWRDCVTDQWSLRAMSGGEPSTQTFAGSILADQAFTTVVGIELEGNDIVDYTTDPNAIDFQLKMKNNARDGFDFTLPSDASACFDLSAIPNDAQLLLGSKHLPITLPFSLATLGTCLSINIDDVSVNESDSTATFTVGLSAASQDIITVDYATQNGTAFAGSDYSPASGFVTFNPGETTQPIDVPILQDALAEGTEQFTVELNNPVNASIADGSGQADIFDDEINPCGEPIYDKASEIGLFLWRDCGSGQWTMRVTGGGSSSLLMYEGEIVADPQAFSTVTGFSLEGADIVDYMSDPLRIGYSLRVKNSGEDGIDFSYPSGTNVCFDTSSLPTGAQVMVGANRQVLTPPFDLEGLSTCSTSLGIDDVSVNEFDGTATFTVSLSAMSSDTVNVSYTTTDISATGGSDYTTSSGIVTFNPGETTQPIDIQILQDFIGEGDETFNVELSNAVNAAIGDSEGIATILDDDISPCGEPSYSPGSDFGVFLWRDCGVGGTEEQWSARFTAGGNPNLQTYLGNVASDLAFTNVTGFSLEGADVLNTTNPSFIDYTLNMKKAGQDGFDFSYPGGANVCFDVTSLPAGAQIFVGADKSAVAAPFSLQTLAACI